jgi:hypothetical protein
MSGKESRPGRHDDHPPRRIQSKRPDNTRPKAATMECDECGVVFHAGRWSWGAPPLGDVGGGLCPACERIRDRYPAGTIRIPGGLDAQHDELVGLIRNAEQAEKADHPLERLMAVDEQADGGLVVTTTGIHLARAITSKLERRLHREASMRYGEEQNLLFVDFA